MFFLGLAIATDEARIGMSKKKKKKMSLVSLAIVSACILAHP